MDYFDLGPFSRTITTHAPAAQVWFDRGLNWVYGFNHMEAIACFRKALEYDADCAMAHWGVAYAAGPNYNLPWHLLDPAGRAKPWPWPTMRRNKPWPWPRAPARWNRR